MDNLQEKLAQIMSDPETMSKVQSLGQMLGLGKENPPVENTPSTGVSNHNYNNRKHGEESSAFLNNGVSGEMMGKLIKLMPVFQQMNQEDDVTRLLHALRPFLSEEKCKKLESAKKMLQMIKIIPLLKEVGIVDAGLF